NAANRTGDGPKRRAARLARRSAERAGKRKRARKAAIDRKSRAVDIRCLVVRRKQRDRSDVFGLAGLLQRIVLTDFLFLSGFAHAVDKRLGLPVSIRPGQMALTRTPLPRKEAAAVCARLITLALLAL